MYLTRYWHKRLFQCRVLYVGHFSKVIFIIYKVGEVGEVGEITAI